MDNITDNTTAVSANDPATVTGMSFDGKIAPQEENTHDIPVMDYDLAQKSSQVQNILTPDALKDSEASYNIIAYKIVKIAEDQLKSQNESKITLKDNLSVFFKDYWRVPLLAASIISLEA